MLVTLGNGEQIYYESEQIHNDMQNAIEITLDYMNEYGLDAYTAEQNAFFDIAADKAVRGCGFDQECLAKQLTSN